MKKLLHTIIALVLLSTFAFGQDADKPIRTEESFYHQKGQHNFNIGTGIMKNPDQFGFSLFTGGSGAGQPSPAINLSYEYGLFKPLSIGAFVGFYKVNAEQEYSFSDLSDLIESDPACLIECFSPIPLGVATCNCGGQTIKERVSVFTVAGKFGWHLVKLPRLDIYTNAILGYSFNKRETVLESAIATLSDELALNVEVPKIVYYAAAGARYYITPNWGIFGEFGYSNVHLLHLGATYRLD